MPTLPILKRYKEEKIKMLEREFCLLMTDEEKEHMNSLTSEIRVDAYARQLIMGR